MMLAMIVSLQLHLHCYVVSIMLLSKGRGPAPVRLCSQAAMMLAMIVSLQLHLHSYVVSMLLLKGRSQAPARTDQRVMMTMGVLMIFFFHHLNFALLPH
jgi:hypothetical protein